VQPFGPQFEVFKVLHKVFMMSTTVRGEPIVTLKCEPEVGVAVRQHHPSISPGYHMNKRHWISLAQGPGVGQDLVSELVSNAYLLVTDAFTRQQRADLSRESMTAPKPVSPHPPARLVGVNAPH
jgi:predicted DNA-binding protein (MmcQ/YjbR family)